jgi:hypothetical protein
MHIFHTVLLAFMFQVSSKGQDKTYNILYAHSVCLQLYLNKNIIQHDDSQKPEERLETAL